ARVPRPQRLLPALRRADLGLPAPAHRPLSVAGVELCPAGAEHPMTQARVDDHPIGLVVDDDLRRNRLTVFFRLLLAIPQAIWLGLWSIAAAIAVFAAWFAALFTGSVPD